MREEPEIEIEMSPLCHSYSEGEVSLQVDIYRSQFSDWTLEVVNPSGTSIVWNDTFANDHEALAEFRRTVASEGAQTFLDNGEESAT